MSDDTSTQDDTDTASEGARADTAPAGTTTGRAERTGPDHSLRNFLIGFLAASAVVVVLAFVIEATAG
jgi:hypothetical protein